MKLIALLEVHSVQRSLAFELNTNIERVEMYEVYTWCHGQFVYFVNFGS